MKKKILSLTLALGLAFTALTGCTNLNDSSSAGIDENKTQLYVVTYNGGWGQEWLKSMANEFEDIMKDYIHPKTGKKGVQVRIREGKADVTGDNVSSLMASSVNDVYFTTYNLRQLNLQGKLMDITEVVANTNSGEFKEVWEDQGETGTIADKMDNIIKQNVLAADSSGSKYFGIPMYSSFYPIIYDVDLFYQEGYFISREYETTGNEDAMFVPAAPEKEDEEYVNSLRSYGRDQKPGTPDDGLPVTMEEFEWLMSKMIGGEGQKVTPFTWAGKMSDYRLGLQANLWAAYEGAQDFMVAVNGEGTFDINSTGEKISITKENSNTLGHRIAEQEGRLQALKFAETIVSNSDYYDGANCFTGTDHTGGQNAYLQSAVSQSGRMAMFLEGGWWENESLAIQTSMATKYPELKNRRFGVMPFPYMDNKSFGYKDGELDASLEGVMPILAVTPDSNVAIRKDATQPDLAKKFLVFTTTDKNLKLYTGMTGSTRPYTYNYTEEEMDALNMSNFKRDLVYYYSLAKKHDQIVYISGSSKFSEFNPGIVTGSFNSTYKDVAMKINGKDVSGTDAFRLFYDNSNVTAEEYHEALCNYWATKGSGENANKTNYEQIYLKNLKN